MRIGVWCVALGMPLLCACTNFRFGGPEAAGVVYPAFTFLSHSTVKYFGYYGSAFEDTICNSGTLGCAPSASGSAADQVSAVRGISNTVWIRANTSGEVAKRLEEAARNGLKAIVDVQVVFFPHHSTKLFYNFYQRFLEFHNAIAQYENIIIGYHIYDEPYLNNVRPWNDTVSPEILYANLYFAVDTINNISPGKHTMTIFSGNEVASENPNDPVFDPAILADFGSKIPPNLDWIGFDCYIDNTFCTDDVVKELFSNFVSFARAANQKVIMIPDAVSLTQWPQNPTPQEIQDIEKPILNRIFLNRSLIASSDRVVGVFPFLYQSDVSFPHAPLHGAVDLPSVLDMYKVYYQALQSHVVCRDNDLVYVQSGKRITNAPECISRCEETDLVQRDALGNEITRVSNATVCQPLI